MKTRINILNTYVDNLTMNDTVNCVKRAIEEDKQIHHTVINAWKIVALQKDLELRKSVNEADLINADGQAVIWASKILKKPLKERVAGIDLMANLVEMAFKNGYKIFLLGAEERVVSKLVKIYSDKYSFNMIAGHRNGYFNKKNEPEIAQQIVDSGAQLLFVAISSPKKEKFLYNNKKLLKKINFMMGVGGSFDVMTGEVKRAPQRIQKLGLEWLYRFIQEPRRLWRRYLIGNLKFILLVLREKISPSISE